MGSPEGQSESAKWLMQGIHTQKNETEALKWYESAAENGIPEAMAALVDIYGKGTATIPKDEAKKQYWQNKLSGQ